MSTETMIESIVEAIETYESNRRGKRIRTAWAQRGLSRTEGARENRARRLAERQGLKLSKSRRDLGYGSWLVIDANSNGLLTSERGMSLEEVETYLEEGTDGKPTDQNAASTALPGILPIVPNHEAIR